jgi:hypothetical protein
MFKNFNLNNGRVWGLPGPSPVPLFKYSFVNYTLAVYTFIYMLSFYTLGSFICCVVIRSDVTHWEHYMLESFICSDVILSVFIHSDIICSGVIRCVIICSLGKSEGGVVVGEDDHDGVRINQAAHNSM